MRCVFLAYLERMLVGLALLHPVKIYLLLWNGDLPIDKVGTL